MQNTCKGLETRLRLYFLRAERTPPPEAPNGYRQLPSWRGLRCPRCIRVFYPLYAGRHSSIGPIAVFCAGCLRVVETIAKAARNHSILAAPPRLSAELDADDFVGQGAGSAQISDAFFKFYFICPKPNHDTTLPADGGNACTPAGKSRLPGAGIFAIDRHRCSAKSGGI